MSSAYYYLYYQKKKYVLIRILVYYKMLMALDTSYITDTNTHHPHVTVHCLYVNVPFYVSLR